jgi:hypothetical protein
MRVTNDTRERDDESMGWDAIAPSYEDSMRRIDVENYIFHLDMKESIVLLFTASGYGPEDIRKILKYRDVNTIYQIRARMRSNAIKEAEF